jgi:hypothetical protein
MAKQVTVKLPDSLYKRTQRFANLHQQRLEDAISLLLEQALAVGEASEEMIDWSEPDPAADREMEAYIALHPSLKEQYLGKYVAIYHSNLVDYDDNPVALIERIEEQYPDEFVWLTQVGLEPIQTFVFRSPRIIRE